VFVKLRDFHGLFKAQFCIGCKYGVPSPVYAPFGKEDRYLEAIDLANILIVVQLQGPLSRHFALALSELFDGIFFPIYGQLAVVLVHPNDVHLFINLQKFVYQTHRGEPTIRQNIIDFYLALVDALEHINEHIRFFRVQFFKAFYNGQSLVPFGFLLLFPLFFGQAIFVLFVVLVFPVEAKIHGDENAPVPIARDKKLKAKNEAVIHMVESLGDPFYFFAALPYIGIIKYQTFMVVPWRVEITVKGQVAFYEQQKQVAPIHPLIGQRPIIGVFLGFRFNCSLAVKNRTQAVHIHKRECQDQLYQLPKRNTGLFHRLKKF